MKYNSEQAQTIDWAIDATYESIDDTDIGEDYSAEDLEEARMDAEYIAQNSWSLLGNCEKDEGLSFAMVYARAFDRIHGNVS